MLKLDIENIRNSHNSIKRNIHEIKDLMINNIEKILDRGEKIENLIVKTDELSNLSHGFRITTRNLKTTLCCRNLKLF